MNKPTGKKISIFFIIIVIALVGLVLVLSFNMGGKNQNELSNYIKVPPSVERGKNTWDSVEPGITKDSELPTKIGKPLQGSAVVGNLTKKSFNKYGPASPVTVWENSDGVVNVMQVPAIETTYLKDAIARMGITSQETVYYATCSPDIALHEYKDAGVAFKVRNPSGEIFGYYYFEAGNDNTFISLTANSFSKTPITNPTCGEKFTQ
jgi:hypothetical protein